MNAGYKFQGSSFLLAGNILCINWPIKEVPKALLTAKFLTTQNQTSAFQSLVLTKTGLYPSDVLFFLLQCKILVQTNNYVLSILCAEKQLL